MIQIADNHNILCFASDSYLPSMEQELKHGISGLLLSTVSQINESGDVESTINEVLPQIFDIRCKVISYLLENSLMHEALNINSIYTDFNRESLSAELQVLVKNVLFALRTTNRVLNKLMKNKEFNISELEGFKNLSYNQFLSTIALTIPNQNLAQIIVDYIHSSLTIELILLISKNLIDEKISISNQSIEGLSKVISDASQNFYAFATKLGLVQKNSIDLTYVNLNDCVSDIDEQKLLADLGLNELAYLS